ncbi:MAG TPA: DUF2298 domain-containing protein [Candidatus Methylacidiphilales bacterium]|jgi:hypothetical protein|nr:DUF2298 domain-containing protein [Candidatus Methylacidiphilales bacterium]
MLLIRVVILAALVGLHVIGGAVLFRKLFPRESPWWGFFAPTLALLFALDFIEHGLALPHLFWVLPVSTCALLWLVATSGRTAKVLLIPGAIFLGAFAFTLLIKCLQPDINFYCTEDLTDTNRILNFCLGDKLPPTDSWLPPYPHTGYYTFMQYGASVMKRLLDIDVGTACNIGSALVSAFTLLGAGAAAYSLSRGRLLVTIVVVILYAAGFTGSSPSVTLFQPNDPAPTASIDIGGGDPGDTIHKIFLRLMQSDAPDIAYRIYTPGCYIYYPEFHATMGGHLVAVWAVFAAAELMRRKRSVVPWVYLIVAPFLAFLTCSWFIFMVGLLAGTMLFAWFIGRKPPNWQHVAMGGAVGVTLLWPALNDLSHGAAPAVFNWSWDLLRDRWTFIIQWWPIYLPWLLLCFFWPRMNPAQRWLHFLFIPILLATELFYFDERGTMLEKTWSGTFGIGMAMLYPTLFAQRVWSCRVLSAVILLTGFASLGAYTLGAYEFAKGTGAFLHLEGDHFIQQNPQMSRMEEVLSRIHGQNVVTGIAHRAFFESTALPAFTENRCYLGWTNAEETCGHPGEANFREQQINDFFAGKLADPMAFLQLNKIAAILVWPDDHITPDNLAALKKTLEPTYAYIDCKGDGGDNAGVFLRNPTPDEAEPPRE